MLAQSELRNLLNELDKKNSRVDLLNKEDRKASKYKWIQLCIQLMHES